jgi:hypothetical protein
LLKIVSQQPSNLTISFFWAYVNKIQPFLK